MTQLNIKGLKVHTIVVDGDNDRQWQEIAGSKRLVERFAVRPGKRLVRYVLLPSSFAPTYESLFTAISESGFIHPDPVVTEAIARWYPGDELGFSQVVGICGTQHQASPHSHCWLFRGSNYSLHIELSKLDSRGNRHWEYIVVLSDEPLVERQDINGLEVHEMVVEPRVWPEKFRCHGVCQDLRTGDFPASPGRRLVRYVFLPFGYVTTNREVMSTITRCNLTHPDMAATVSILKARQAKYADNRVVSICGVAQADMRGQLIVGVVREHHGELSVGLEAIDGRSEQDCLFIAIVSEEPMIE